MWSKITNKFPRSWRRPFPFLLTVTCMNHVSKSWRGFIFLRLGNRVFAIQRNSVLITTQCLLRKTRGTFALRSFCFGSLEVNSHERWDPVSVCMLRTLRLISKCNFCFTHDGSLSCPRKMRTKAAGGGRTAVSIRTRAEGNYRNPSVQRTKENE